jgi:hypothetical protein
MKCLMSAVIVLIASVCSPAFAQAQFVDATCWTPAYSTTFPCEPKASDVELYSYSATVVANVQGKCDDGSVVQRIWASSFAACGEFVVDLTAESGMGIYNYTIAAYTNIKKSDSGAIFTSASIARWCDGSINPTQPQYAPC